MSKFSKEQLPPGNIPLEKTPQFIAFGFDDNGYSGLLPPNERGGLNWASHFFSSVTNPKGSGNPGTFDGAKGRVALYFTTFYIEHTNEDPPDYVKQAWIEALEMGHEPGIHTHSHPSTTNFKPEQFKAEIDQCYEWLMKPAIERPSKAILGDQTKGIGLDKSKVFGYRSPFLDFNYDLFPVLHKMGFGYDCTVQVGYNDDQDAQGQFWPFEWLSEHSMVPSEQNCPGLYEMPAYPYMLPSDDECEKYGVEPGLRKRIADRTPEYDRTDGKIIGLDWDMFVTYSMNKAECLASLKYTLDQRLKGNRCPLLFGGHTDLYSENNPFPKRITAQERREVLEEFTLWALEKPDVRLAAPADILQWLKKPVALS